jgi:hypothetical protein
MDEFIQEGKYASHETLKGYAYSWQMLSLLIQEVITGGMYVPELLPDENQPVLLVVIKEATVLKAKSLHCETPEVLISLASHTGEPVWDDDGGSGKRRPICLYFVIPCLYWPLLSECQPSNDAQLRPLIRDP